MNVTRIPGKPARKLVTFTMEMAPDLVAGIPVGHETTTINTVPGKTSLIRFEAIEDLPPEADEYRLDGVTIGEMFLAQKAGIVAPGWPS